MPEIREDDLEPGGAGVRAQAMLPDGKLVEDFHFEEARGILHVINAPSPAATASLAIGQKISEKVLTQLNLSGKNHRMNILVTGHRGYIGPHLVKLLKDAGHHVTGIDIGYFECCNWEPLPAADKEIHASFRSLTEKDLQGYDAVCHLAAISNDPMGDLDEKLTYDTNRDGSIELARRAKNAGVPRFLFSGSCSVYGKGEKLDLDESAKFNPVSAYAVSKVETEKNVAPLADKNFSPAFLRNATAYGYSPNLRIDLVANNLLACAIARGDIRIMSDGKPWRPLVHCHDIARAFVLFAERATRENPQPGRQHRRQRAKLPGARRR